MTDSISISISSFDSSLQVETIFERINLGERNSTCWNFLTLTGGLHESNWLSLTWINVSLVRDFTKIVSRNWLFLLIKICHKFSAVGGNLMKRLWLIWLICSHGVRNVLFRRNWGGLNGLGVRFSFGAKGFLMIFSITFFPLLIASRWGHTFLYVVIIVGLAT